MCNSRIPKMANPTYIHSEMMKHILNFPPNTRVEFKSHDSSIQQRTALDEHRREKATQHHHEKRQGRHTE